MAAIPIAYQTVDAEEVSAHVVELSDLYREVYAEPPYEWGPEHAELFEKRFEVQRLQEGFALAEARHEGRLIGMGFGVTLLPNTPWWQNLLTPLTTEMIEERPGRTWALVELLVRAPWRRKHVAQELHELLLAERTEERATLTVLPEASPAQAAYQKWGWRRVGQKHNPLPGAPVFDVMVKSLSGNAARKTS